MLTIASLQSRTSIFSILSFSLLCPTQTTHKGTFIWELKMRRFERIHDVVEPVEAYRRGGYHPVHLHDIFNQRYEVIGKLAYGQFSTVWLANDQL